MEGDLMRRIGYARVSTQGQDLGQQLETIKSSGCDLVFGEKVSSTTPETKRQELQKALQSLQPGDVLVVSKLDRLGRTQSEVVARLASLSERRVFVQTLDGLLNTQALGRMAPLVIGLLSGLAEVERSLIQERTKESIEHRRRIGGNLGGRPPLPESRRSLVLRLRHEGKTFREISESTGCALSTCHKICFEEAA